jgi:hypothetical protein
VIYRSSFSNSLVSIPFIEIYEYVKLPAGSVPLLLTLISCERDKYNLCFVIFITLTLSEYALLKPLHSTHRIYASHTSSLLRGICIIQALSHCHNEMFSKPNYTSVFQIFHKIWDYGHVLKTLLYSFNKTDSLYGKYCYRQPFQLSTHSRGSGSGVQKHPEGPGIYSTISTDWKSGLPILEEPTEK